MRKRLTQNILLTLLSLGLVFSMLLLNLQAGSAAPETPFCEGEGCATTGLPQVEGEPEVQTRAGLLETYNQLLFSSLKAVLIVGPIDGDEGAWTKREIENANLTADVLTRVGVEVIKFYPPNNRWEDIRAAAQGAHFLMYRGHGISWGGTPEKVGGFALKNNLVSPEEITTDLHLAKNAIVMIYACYAAGTTSTDQPPGITQQEAQRRVAQYSAPFFQNGAAGYYADWYGHAFALFLEDLFSGITLGQAYQNFNFNPATFSNLEHLYAPGQRIWLDSHFYADQNQYNHAFAGQPDQTLASLFAPRMQVGPAEINHTAGVLSLPKSFLVYVESNSSYPFTWNADLLAESPWIELSSQQGINGETFSVSLDPQGLQTGSYTSELRVRTSTPGVLDNEQVLPITLNVVEGLREISIFLPMVVRR